MITQSQQTDKIFLCAFAESFAINQLAKHGFDSVTPVVILALALTLTEDLTQDRSLCPVRALKYYLVATKVLRKGTELLLSHARRAILETSGLPPSCLGSGKRFCYATRGS